MKRPALAPANQYCPAVDDEGRPCVRFVNHGGMHLANGEHGPAVLWPVQCAACGDTGILSFSHEPYSKGFGHITEAIPCACRRRT